MTGLAALTLALSALAPAAEPVGFIWHYPFVDVGTDELAGAGASAMVARAPWAVMEPEPGRFELGCLEQQLGVAEAAGLHLVLLLECNPFCAPRWLRDEVHRAGECALDLDGGDSEHVPRPLSPTFLRAQRRFLESVIGFVQTRDRRRIITHYQAGVEWWFPPSWRYAPEDIALFREWLARKHGGLAGINRRWESRFGELGAVPAPALSTRDLWLRGRAELAPITLLDPLQRGETNLRAASHDWSLFWQEAAAETIERHAAIVHQLDPSRPVVSFLTLSFAYGAEWDYSEWSAIAPDVVAASTPSLAALGMQLPVAHGDAERVTFALDLARKYGKPMWAIDLVDFPRGVAGSRETIERASLCAIQHGARGLIYCCWNGAKDYDYYPTWPVEEIREMLAASRRALRLTRGMACQPSGAVVHPFMPAGPDDATGWRNDPASAMGWRRILEELQEPIDAVTLWELANGGADLARYAWVLVPDCAALPREALQRLREYSAGGGRLIVAGRFAEQDERGRAFPERDTEWLRAVARVPNLGARYAGRPVREGAAGDTPPMVTIPSSHAPASEAARAEARRCLAPVLAAGLRRAVLEPDTPDVSAMPFTRGDASGLFLVRRVTGDVGDLRVTVPGRMPRDCAVWLDGARRHLAPLAGPDGTFALRVPPFRTSCIALWR